MKLSALGAAFLLAFALAGPVSASTGPTTAGATTTVYTETITGPECTREQKLAFQPASAPCVITTTIRKNAVVQRQAPFSSRGWYYGSGTLKVALAFNIYEVQTDFTFKFNYFSVYLTGQDCSYNSYWGTAINITNCNTLYDGGLDYGYMAPGLSWTSSLLSFSAGHWARIRVYTIGYVCCSYGHHG